MSGDLKTINKYMKLGQIAADYGLNLSVPKGKNKFIITLCNKGTCQFNTLTSVAEFLRGYDMAMTEVDPTQ